MWQLSTVDNYLVQKFLLIKRSDIPEIRPRRCVKHYCYDKDSVKNDIAYSAYSLHINVKL